MVKSLTQFPGKMLADGLEVMAPSQLSVAVRSTGGGKSAAHAKFKSIGGEGGTGANSSKTTIV